MRSPIPDTYIQVVHLHPNNSDHIQRKGRNYRTLAMLRRDGDGEVLEQTEAVCNLYDQPSRKRGYEIALGRLNRKIKDIIND